MATHYKPSQWRGKRLVYRSTDPDEPNYDGIVRIAVLIVAIFLLVVGLYFLFAE